MLEKNLKGMGYLAASPQKLWANDKVMVYDVSNISAPKIVVCGGIVLSRSMEKYMEGEMTRLKEVWTIAQGVVDVASSDQNTHALEKFYFSDLEAKYRIYRKS